MTQHNFRLDELDNMMPWEGEIYLSLLDQHIKEQNERMKKRNG